MERQEFVPIRIEQEISADARQILEAIGRLLWDVHQLREEVFTMSSSIVTRAQFDAALANLQAAEAARDAAVTQSLTDLIAKVNAGTVTTPDDFTAELATITTLQTNAAALTQTATADDPGPTTVSTAPATPAATTAS